MADLNNPATGSLAQRIHSDNSGVLDISQILQDFSGDPQKSDGLARFLGFDPIPNPEDQLAGPLTAGLRQFFGRSGDKFGVSELYRIGIRQAHPASAGLWISILSDWGSRPSDRDRARRQIARALATEIPERRSLALLVPPLRDKRGEVELIFPRTSVSDSGDRSDQTISNIRAFIDLYNPTRFHRDLLYKLRIPDGASLADISRHWREQFSVERVTTEFYKQYAAVRDRMAAMLVDNNKGHSVVQRLAEDEARAWATRQMGRVLFLWFLQAKSWLGEPDGKGSATYLLDLWSKRLETKDKHYYKGILEPLFFDAMATGTNSDTDPVLGHVPYLNGGLFRRSRQEDEINDEGGVSLPDELFDPTDEDSLLALLSRYRFTTQESTPDDQSVDPDPELLGRVFENLYQGDERHDTGTYYTPREMVHFMCRETLDGYLRDSTAVDQETLNQLRELAVGSHDERFALDDTLRDRLVDSLETVRVCDPAVGSGAYLVGIIQEIVLLRRGIMFSMDGHIEPTELYHHVTSWKQHAIESSLYGVDINPEAIEICRLRLWLSMVLDMEEPPSPDSDWALPNLDFQIVAGDSLVDRIAGITFKESWPTPQALQLELDLQGKLQSLEEDITQSKKEFQRTKRNPTRLRELRDHIAFVQSQIILLHLEDALKRAEHDAVSGRSVAAKKSAQNRAKRIYALISDLDSRDFTLVQKPFLWPTAFPEILRHGDVNSGFDIILANPPYVRMEKIDNEDEQAYGEAFPEVRASRADLLVYFFGRAVQILKPGGWLAFITSNKYMKSGYGEGIRNHLKNRLVMTRIITFGDLPIFEAEGKPIAAYPAVLIGKRGEGKEDALLQVADLTYPVRQILHDQSSAINADNVRTTLENLGGLLATSGITDYPQLLLGKDEWILESPSLVRLINRLMDTGTPLGEFVNSRIFRGTVTGLNKAFIIDQSTRDALVEEDPKCTELVKPWLRGRDIKRWNAVWAGQHVIFTHRGVDIERYPSLKKYLLAFRDQLERRATAALHPWYELQQPQEGIYSEYALPKIIWPRNNNPLRMDFAYDVSGYYLNDKGYFIPRGSLWLLALLNSTLMHMLVSMLCTKLQNGWFELMADSVVARLPIITPSENTKRLLEDVATGQQAEELLDPMVAEMYGLNESDSYAVKAWFDKQKATFARSDRRQGR